MTWISNGCARSAVITTPLRAARTLRGEAAGREGVRKGKMSEETKPQGLVCEHPYSQLWFGTEWCPECGAIRVQDEGRFQPWKIPLVTIHKTRDPNYGSGRYYCYRLEEEESGEYYIGVRSCCVPPEQDGKYLGSGRWPKYCAKVGVYLAKQIISEHPTFAAALREEQKLIAASVTDPRCMNRWRPDI